MHAGTNTYNVMELVSVIIPNFNHARFLSQRLESVYNQSYPHFEVIILDDSSSDDSRTIIESYRDHPRTAHIVFNDTNSGSAFAQWKKGIAQAKGKFIWLAESDDFCDLNFLETALSRLSEGFDLFFAKTIRVEEDGSIMTKNPYHWFLDISPERWLSDFENDAKAEVRDVLFKKCAINNASAVVFRNHQRIFRYLDELDGMFYAGDWLFWIQYLLESDRMCYSIKTTNYFRTHPGVTRLKTPERRNSEILHIYKFIVRQTLSKGKRNDLAQYFFDMHIYKGTNRELGRNTVLAFRMCLSSLRFVGPWVRYYFTRAPK